MVPFNDLAEARRAFEENPDRIAGMIVEPAMMNCGVILPEPGYLQGLKDLCHANGAYLAFDEVKTGATLAYGGATRCFGVTPDIVCLAKAIGGGPPCGAIGATRELYRPVIEDKYDMAGHVQREPADDGRVARHADGGAGPRRLRRVRPHRQIMKDGLSDVVAGLRPAAYVTGVGAKGSVIYSTQPVREYRDAVGIDERISYLAWLFQQNRGVFKSPWTKQETWTLSVFHSEDDAARYIANFEEFAAAVTGN